MIVMIVIIIIIIIITIITFVIDVKKSSVSMSSKLLSMMRVFQTGVDEEERRYINADKAMLIAFYHDKVW